MGFSIMNEFVRMTQIYNLFIQRAKEINLNYIYFFHYIYVYYRYDVSVNTYFKHKLYDSNISHNDFYKSTRKYFRSFTQSQKRFMPNVSISWVFFHYLDYLLNKIRYAGLDGMDYFMYEFYNIRDSKKKTFITDGSMQKMVYHFNRDRYQNADSHELLRDKGKFNTFFSDIISRKWIVSENLELQDFLHFCNGLDKVIVKPICGQGGKDIYITETENEESIIKLYSQIKNGSYIIEEIIKQHPDLARINNSSVNTIRVYSVQKDNEIFITGAVLRMGRDNSLIDNYSTGGLAAEIDVDLGIVISRAVTHNNDSMYVHPDSSVILIGFKIPLWEEIRETVKTAHLRIPLLRYIAWDVVVTNENKITFIEANALGGVGIQQHPLLVGKKPIYEKYY